MRQMIVAVAMLLASVVGRAAVGEMVYDSLPTMPLVLGRHGSMGSGVPEVGQTVQLAGSARRVTRVDLTLGASALAEFQLRFYLLNGASGTPGTMFWEGALQNYPWEPPSFNRNIVGVNVPGIVVSDEFVLAVSNVRNVSVLTVDGPTVGQHTDLWLLSEDKWISFVFAHTVGARITAVPEPSTFALFAIGCAAIGWRRR